MSRPTPPAPPSRSTRGWGAAAQSAGVVGIGASLLLVALVLLGRGWAVGRLEDVGGRLDGGVAMGTVLLDAAAERVEGVAVSVGSVGEAVRARAADPGPVAEGVQSVLARATEASDRYLAMRARYADARERLVSVLDRLGVLRSVVPVGSAPRGPEEVLASLDEKARALDARMAELLGAIPEAGSGEVALAVAERVDLVRSSLTDLSAGLGGARDRWAGLRSALTTWVGSVRRVLTLVSIGLILAALYFALLHGVLFHTGRRMRRGAAPAT